TALPSHGQTSSLSIAKLLLDDITSPSQAAVRAEEIQELRSALESMNETDREVLAMRHFEHLNNQQVAEVLGLSPTAASNRYIRAAVKLGEILKSLSSRHGPP
ncbi:MAG: sigma-70 family RNA polymerase sigma factor, partial [Pirellula staleyi]